jgi:perosamine synthetase
VRLPEGVDQRTAMQAMLDKEISSPCGIVCAHREGPYAQSPLRHPLPESERAQDRCVLLPLYPQMTYEDQIRVATILEEACQWT